ncbi:hypothetical protein [Planktothrix serta]|uniref:hypothetical protein n=1 Tax=Planktothrix serta TaxID=1678310 RepID=UPI0012DDB033|nr:hypothetical protein [Planktothrix serta]
MNFIIFCHSFYITRFGYIWVYYQKWEPEDPHHKERWCRDEWRDIKKQITDSVLECKT